MKKYKELELEIIMFNNVDVIGESEEDETPDDNS